MFDVKTLPSDGPNARVGLIVPKYNYSAVQRNKLKRRLRELTRTQLHNAERPSVQDVLLRAKKVAYDASFDELHAEIARLGAVILSRVPSEAGQVKDLQ